jgi:hypothetical protein
MISDGLASDVTEEQIEQYYSEHRDEYRVENPVREESAEEGDAAAPKGPIYRPLEVVAEKIRRTLARQRARETIDRAFDEITSYLYDYREELSLWNLDKTKAEKPTPPNMDGLANRYGLPWRRTPLLDEFEATAIDNEIGAFRGFKRPFQWGSGRLEVCSFVGMAYDDELPLYRPCRMTILSGDEILAWKVAETESYEPSLNEARDEIILAWKRGKARQFARAEASKVARRAHESDVSLEEQAAESHSVFRVEDCSYFRDSSTSGPLLLSEIDPIERPGRVFLDKLFAMARGQIGVLSNAPETIVYVVSVAREMPSADLLRDAFVAELCSTSPQGIRLPLELSTCVSFDRSEIARDWIADVESDLEVCRDVHPSADYPLAPVAEGPQPPAEGTAWGDLLLAVLENDVERLERIANDREGSEIGP